MADVPLLFDFHYDDRMPRFEAVRWGYGPSRGTVLAALACIGLAVGSVALLAARDVLLVRAPALSRDRERDEAGAPVARPPDRAQVERAYARAREVFEAGGVAGLAEEGEGCFEALERRPEVARLDFCLAFDAFASGVHRIAGSRGAPDATAYFNNAPVRHIRATDAVGVSRTEANARVVALGRLAAAVTRANAEEDPIIIAPPAPAPEDLSAAAPAAEAPPPSDEAPYRAIGPAPEAPPAAPAVAAPPTPDAAEQPPG